MLQGASKPQQATSNNKPNNVSGSGYWERGLLLCSLSSTHAGALLLFIASSLIALPAMQESAKSFLLVVFACVALLQSS
jgi:hypothetical protein